MIYLFSSNASPQYAQDILNVLAAPRGGLYTFRYERKYVEAELASQWDARLEDARVLVCFSLQQRGAYADPAFIPVRAGTVVAAYPVGSQLIVTFRMDEIVALQPNRGGYGKPDQVKHFTEWLKTNVRHVPYAFSASRGPSALDEVWLDNATGVREQGTIFEAATKWLEPTETFNQARFVRFGSIRERGPNGEEARLDADGRLNLVAGRTHTLRVIHYQPSPVSDRQAFAVAVDQDVVRIIGRPGFDVASRYNETRLELHAQPIERAGAAETVLVIDAAAGVQGPRIVIPIKVTTPGTRVALAVGGPALTLGLIGLPTLAGLEEPFNWLSILGGILLAAVFQYAGLRGLGIRNPFTAAPTHAGSDGQQ